MCKIKEEERRKKGLPLQSNARTNASKFTVVVDETTIAAVSIPRTPKRNNRAKPAASLFFVKDSQRTYKNG